jgi:hypothetical protein
MASPPGCRSLPLSLAYISRGRAHLTLFLYSRTLHALHPSPHLGAALPPIDLHRRAITGHLEVLIGRRRPSHLQEHRRLPEPPVPNLRRLCPLVAVLLVVASHQGEKSSPYPFSLSRGT